jgi:hypothetical protein
VEIKRFRNREYMLEPINVRTEDAKAKKALSTKEHKVKDNLRKLFMTNNQHYTHCKKENSKLISILAKNELDKPIIMNEKFNVIWKKSHSPQRKSKSPEKTDHCPKDKDEEVKDQIFNQYSVQYDLKKHKMFRYIKN